jgi:hypothetical protein
MLVEQKCLSINSESFINGTLHAPQQLNQFMMLDRKVGCVKVGKYSSVSGGTYVRCVETHQANGR